MSETLWTAAQAAAAIDGEAQGDWAVGGASFDTRELRNGDLFIALKGESRDGHDFVAQALEAGAGAALVERTPPGLGAEAPLLFSPVDTLKALERLGAAGRARARDMTAIAVTGSVGKTSTKDMLGAMLAEQGATHAAVKSFNNHLGVPLTLTRTPPTTRFGVYEIGMNAPGEIAPLSRMVRPHVAMITIVGLVHIEAFEAGIEGVADEKASIFEGLEEDGVAVLNRDDPQFERLAARAHECGASRVLEFGERGRHARLISVTLSAAATEVEAELNGAPLQFSIGAPGRHFAMNARGALLSIEAVGGDPAAAARRLASWGAVEGRGSRMALDVSGGEILLVDESYNANPSSLRAAIETFAETAPPAVDGRRIAFLTDMLELGPQAERYHADIAQLAATRKLDLVHTAGPLLAALHDALPDQVRGTHVETAEALAELALGVVQAGDAVMVKGSLGSKARLIAEALKAPRDV
ncbi:MAG: UDP-N-acetylmuramoyl-tripeptide--D-alanyl-D-alanine ligase [Neomegalonema sp.]